MINPLDIYFKCGVQAYDAMHKRTGSSGQLCSWAERAIRLESPEERQAARKAFDDGYKSNQAEPLPFR